MPWVVGIDEAGYGPNLGPLVQACVGLFLPDGDDSGWLTLKETIRRVGEPADGRLVVDDSKKVYSGGAGFEELERTVLGMSVARDVGHLCVTYSRGEDTLSDEMWFEPDRRFPLSISDDERDTVNDRWVNTPALADVGGYILQPYPTATKRFNELVDQFGTKSAVVANRLVTMFRESLKECRQPLTGNDREPVRFVCDKLGGRNFYGPILQEAFPDGWPVAEVEGAAESRYRIMNLGRDITVSFRPRADGENVCVALASMLAKYVREVCMKQFNEFWAKHVPGIKPTAGYPVDAKRFYAEIRPTMARLGIAPDAVWRKK